MKNLLSRFLFLIIKASLIAFLLLPSDILAWEDCPFGLINDPYPGECVCYIDTDNDGICDLSQSAPLDRGILNIPYEIKYKNEIKTKFDVYNFLPISLILIFFYALGSFLVKMKVISLVNHRKIWNILLLITFLISGVLGILFMIRLNFGWEITLPFNILFWHIETGIAMTFISIFHIIWHWPYFKKLFKFKRKI